MDLEDCSISLKPFHSPQHPDVKWAVSGPSDSKGKRWRKLFRTLEEAEGFLRRRDTVAVKSNATETPLDLVPPKVAVPTIAASEPLGHGRTARRKRVQTRRVTALSGGVLLILVLAGAFFSDRVLRMKGADAASLLSADFEANPILSGWSSSSAEADWTDSEHHSGRRCLSIERETWTSPAFEVEPLSWYRVSFVTKATGTARKSAVGTCRVCRYDPTGSLLLSEDLTAIPHTFDWELNEIYVRAAPAVIGTGIPPAGKWRIIFTPEDSQKFFFDDLQVAKATSGDVARWAKRRLAESPAKPAYVPKETRWERIPNAMRKLRQRLPLRVVMLGDELQQELANSPFDVLFAQHYPGCRVEVIPSIRPGAGIEFFRDRAADFVSRHRPDLVMINVRSDSDGLAAYQRLVDEVRARGEERGLAPEVVVLTRPPEREGIRLPLAGGALSELDQKSLNNPEIPGDHRGQLLKFAEENHIEFLDLAGILGESSFADSGRDFRQLLGGVVGAYFSPSETKVARESQPVARE